MRLFGGVFGLALVAAVGAAGEADAADLADRFAPLSYTAPAPYNWTGAYFGLNLSPQWGRVTNSGARPSGIGGGGQAGYIWQAGTFVFGGETDLQASGAEDKFASYKFSNPWFGSVRGRAGFAMNNLLFYATAGLSYGDLQVQVAGAGESRSRLGWTAGAGMEVGLTPKWSAKAEYLFMDLSDRAFVLTNASNGFESNQLRVGVNYRF